MGQPKFDPFDEVEDGEDKAWFPQANLLDPNLSYLHKGIEYKEYNWTKYNRHLK